MYLRPILHSLRRLPTAAHTNPAQLCSNWRLLAPLSSANFARLASSHSSPVSATPATGSGGDGGGQQIYYGTLTPKIRAVKVFSLTTSIVGLAVQPMLIEQGSKLGGVPMIVFMCGFAGLFTFVTPVLLHFVTKKYVTQIAYDAARDEYTATTISFFLTRKQHVFKASDVHVPDVTGMFTTFKVKNKALFVDISQFNDPSHYVKMMGFDKPIDFKFDLAHEKPAIDAAEKK